MKLILLAAVLLVASPSKPQAVPITVGMPYANARTILIQNGWQPHIPHGPDLLACSDTDPCTYQGLDQSQKARESFMRAEKALRKAFRERGWFETIHCYPSGRGSCYHLFTDVNKRRLLIETGSGSYGAIPEVSRFFFDATY